MRSSCLGGLWGPYSRELLLYFVLHVQPDCAHVCFNTDNVHVQYSPAHKYTYTQKHKVLQYTYVRNTDMCVHIYIYTHAGWI